MKQNQLHQKQADGKTAESGDKEEDEDILVPLRKLKKDKSKESAGTESESSDEESEDSDSAAEESDSSESESKDKLTSKQSKAEDEKRTKDKKNKDEKKDKLTEHLQKDKSKSRLPERGEKFDFSIGGEDEEEDDFLTVKSRHVPEVEKEEDKDEEVCGCSYLHSYKVIEHKI